MGSLLFLVNGIVIFIDKQAKGKDAVDTAPISQKKANGWYLITNPFRFSLLGNHTRNTSQGDGLLYKFTARHSWEVNPKRYNKK